MRVDDKCSHPHCGDSVRKTQRSCARRLELGLGGFKVLMMEARLRQRLYGSHVLHEHGFHDTRGHLKIFISSGVIIQVTHRLCCTTDSFNFTAKRTFHARLDRLARRSQRIFRSSLVPRGIGFTTLVALRGLDGETLRSAGVIADERHDVVCMTRVLAPPNFKVEATL